TRWGNKRQNAQSITKRAFYLKRHWTAGCEVRIIHPRNGAKRPSREHNLGKIVMGRPASRRWWRRDAFADRLARRAPDLDQVIVAL
ncbi:hypothetical protein MJL48_32965, partial [Salmonella enterica subsp. enterica serovar Kentucky]|nr:hypothetical protein [Salmonella enterica subsp. enterica serovar Kentucky]